MQNRETCCLKNVLIGKDQRDFLCAKILRNITDNENALNCEGFLMHYEGRLCNYLFQLFLKLKSRQEENSSYFSMFNQFSGCIY